MKGLVLASVAIASPAAAEPPAQPEPGALFRSACLTAMPGFARTERFVAGMRPLDPEYVIPRARHIAPAWSAAWWSGVEGQKSLADVELQRVDGRLGPYAASGCTVFAPAMTLAEAEAAVATSLAEAQLIYEDRSDIVGNSRTYLLAQTWGGDRFALLITVWFDGVFGNPPRGAILVVEVIDFADMDPAASSPDTDGLIGALMGILRDRRIRT